MIKLKYVLKKNQVSSECTSQSMLTVRCFIGLLFSGCTKRNDNLSTKSCKHKYLKLDKNVTTLIRICHTFYPRSRSHSRMVGYVTLISLKVEKWMNISRLKCLTLIKNCIF